MAEDELSEELREFNGVIAEQLQVGICTVMCICGEHESDTQLVTLYFSGGTLVEGVEVHLPLDSDALLSVVTGRLATATREILAESVD